MLLCAQLFIEDLTNKNLNFDSREDSDGDVIVRFPYDGKITTFIFTGEEGRYVSMYTVMENVPQEKTADLYAVCNQYNSTLKWFKFYLDKDNDIIVQGDAILSPESAAEECFELLVRRVNVMKEVKAPFMRAIYGGI